MADVQCVTCGQAGEAITDPLFIGKLEAEIKPRSANPAGKNGKACGSWSSTSIRSTWAMKAAENS